MKEKVKISKKHLIPKIVNSVGYDNNNIEFTDEIIEFIIENYTFEGGVRKLKECMLEICKELNLRMLSGTKLLNKKIKFPLTVTEEMLTKDIFEKRRIQKIDKVRIINTLYLGVIFLDLMHIMITLKKDEREYKIEAISERNASWAMIIVLLVGILYQSTMLGLNGTGSIDLFLVAALIIGMLSKSISNIFLERKSL